MTPGLLARLVVRYVAGYLVIKGLIEAPYGKEIATDADLIALSEFIIGIGGMAATEGFYWLARKMGWRT